MSQQSPESESTLPNSQKVPLVRGPRKQSSSHGNNCEIENLKRLLATISQRLDAFKVRGDDKCGAKSCASTIDNSVAS